MTAPWSRASRIALAWARVAPLAIALFTSRPSHAEPGGAPPLLPGHAHAVARLLADRAEPECPTASDLGDRVNQLLGRQAVVHDQTDEDVRVYWRLEIADADATA